MAPLDPTSRAHADDWLIGGGEVGAAIRSTDWSRTTLGPRERWPQPLRTAISLVVESPFPMAVAWGPDLHLFYNDAYVEILADKHPRALGRSTREVWSEVWPVNEPIFASVMKRGETQYVEDQLLPVSRRGCRGEACFALCYSPLRLESGNVGGVLITLHETTAALARNRVRRESEEKYRKLFEAEADALRRERDRLQAVMNGARSHLVYLDRDFNFVRVNAAYASTCGYRPEEMIGKNHFALYPNDENEGIFARVRDTGEVFEVRDKPFEFPDQPERGTTYWDWTLTPAKDPAGHVEGIVFSLFETTERKRAEEALRESEARYEEITNSLPQLVWTFQPSGQCDYLNRQWVEYTGVPADRQLGVLWLEQIHPEDRAGLMERWRDSLATGRPFTIEVRIRRHDGLFRWFDSRAIPFRGAAGEITKWFGSNTDITDRKLAEEQVRESGRRLQSVIDGTANCFIYAKDLEGRHIVASQALAKFFGQRTPEALLGKTSHDFLPKPVADQHWANDRLVVARGSGVRIEETVDRPTGTRTFISEKFPLRDAAGQMYAVCGVSIDITELKHAEEALHQRERDLREAQRVARVGSWEWLIAGDTVTWSEEMYRIAGLEPQRAAPSRADQRSLYAPESWTQLQALGAGAVESGAPFAVDLELVRPDGTRRWIDMRAETNRDRSGRVIGLRGTAQDITERREAQEALREGDRRKNEFLAMLSHELRNPLAPIRNSLYILEHAVPGGEQAHRAQAIIGRQVGHMTRLVEDLLDITRITRGKARLQYERLELCDLVRRTLDDYQSAFAENGIELQVAITSPALWVEGDRTRLAQVIGNLLQNASKFTPRGGKATVSIAADAVREHAVLRVQDTGRGIPPELVPRVFEAFTQAETSLDRSKGGLGLGLALVKGLVEMHGGTVSAESQGLGQGSTFTIALPLAPSARAETSPASMERRTPSRRVLVIEDNADAADSLREVLELSGHVVDVAYSGPAGIASAQAAVPDIVLCDIGLPGMNGYEVARALRLDPKLEHVSLVALSGYAQPEDVARGRQAGFDAHIAKPPSIEALERVVTQIRSSEG
jgi:PAS domain S-box-containing protein